MTRGGWNREESGCEGDRCGGRREGGGEGGGEEGVVRRDETDTSERNSFGGGRPKRRLLGGLSEG